MLRFLKNITSLDHLSRACNASGQIATLLILLMVIVLGFVLATVNIGQASLEATKIANASDAAVLQLASSLATRGRMLYEGMGYRTKICKKRGFWSIVIAVVAAVVAVVITFLTAGAGGPAAWVVVAAAMGAGAAGGMAGAAIDGTSLTNGFLTGLAIGAAIGSGGYAIGSQCLWSASLAELGLSAPITSGFVATTSFATASLVGSIASGPVAMENKMTKKLLDRLESDTQQLELKDQYRESAFQIALGMLVDDPNTVQDQYDLDGDGNTAEQVPSYASWWHGRLQNLDSLKATQHAFVRNFLNQMRTFRNDIACVSQPASGCSTRATQYMALQKLDYQWNVDSDGNEAAVAGTADGRIINFLNVLATAGYSLGNWRPAGALHDMPLWQRGPQPAQMNTWLDEDCCPDGEEEPGCPSCSAPPAGYDWLDDLADDLRDMRIIMDEIFEQPDPYVTWDVWAYFFVNPEDINDVNTLYHDLQDYLDMLAELRSRLVAGAGLPDCVGGWWGYVSGVRVCGDCPVGRFRLIWRGGTAVMVPLCGNCVRSGAGYPGWPCHLSTAANFSRDGITLDENPNDELQTLRILASIDALRNTITRFRTAMRTFATNVQRSIGEVASTYGTTNRPVYTWTDGRGRSRAIIEAGPFKVPRIRTKRHSWRKTCTYILDYQDEGNCWIRSTLIRPSSQLGFLGRLNPLGIFGTGTSKTSEAYYTIPMSATDNVVGIRRTRR